MLSLSKTLTALKVPTIEVLLRDTTFIRWRAEYPRSFWGGLLHYVTGPVLVTYQGQRDKALHFAFGAWAEITMGLGDEVGVWKEKLDRVFGFGQYDEADMRATSDGAREARLA